MSKLVDCWRSLCGLFHTAMITLHVIAYRGQNRSYKQFDTPLFLWSKKILKIAKCRCRVIGQRCLTSYPRPVFIMCNHSSLMDIPISAYVFEGQTRMMAKESLARIPMWGIAMKKSGMVFIDKNHARRAYTQLDELKNQLSDRVLWCSPEGTRGNGSNLLRFKRGVFQLAKNTGGCILPVTIIGAHHVLPKYAWRIRTDQDVTVRIGQIITAADVQSSSVGELMDAVAEQMTNHLRLGHHDSQPPS
jgi:1-acyl-sn-glycerol-3-phosphate acyltransferase